MTLCIFIADDEVYPLNLLNEELKSDDTEVRIKAMRKVKIVAQALGCERTRTELIPFLNGMSFFFIRLSLLILHFL